MEWLGDDQLILSAGNDLIVLDARTLQEERQIAGVGGRSFDWSPDRQQLITIGGDWLVRIVDFNTGEVLAQEAGHMPQVALMAWKPDGSELAVARMDGSIGVLDGQSGQQTRILRLGGMEIDAMMWNPDGSFLLLDRADGVVEILNGATGQTFSEFYDPWRRDVIEWSPDGQLLAYATYPDPDEGVYDAPSWLKIVTMQGAVVRQYDMNWQDFIFYWNRKPIALSFSPDGMYIGAFYDDRASIWNLATEERIESGEAPLSSGVVLANWEAAGVTFYTARDTYHLSFDGSLQHLKESGLPNGSTPRPDGRIVFGNQMVIDVATQYPFQAFNQYQGGEVVAWHPTCWTTDCETVLAIGQGSQVIMYGYPQEDS
jgi:WD40 repeat protein